jgi:hypothetical protein
MASLPQVPRRLVTTQTPRNRVTADDVAGSMRMAADALGSFAPGVRAIEQRAGEDAGFERAVTTGKDGLPQIENMPPMFGDYAAGYRRAASLTYLAKLGPEVENKIFEAKQKFANDPKGFQEWAGQYGRELVRSAPDPRLRAAVDKMVTSEGAQAWRAVSAEYTRNTINDSRAALGARQESVENKLAALARDGGTSSPEYIAAMDDYDAIDREFVNNPVFGASRAKVEQGRDRMLARHTALAVVGQVSRVAQDKSVDADGNPMGGTLKAKALADAILTDEGLNLTETERRQYHAQGIAEIRSLSAENRALVSQLSVESRELVKAIEGGSIDPDMVQDFLDRAADAGAAKAVGAVIKASSQQHYLRGWFDKLPQGDRARAVIELSGRGGSFVDKVTRVESGNDPNAKASTSSATGAGQFIASTWLGIVRRNAPEVAAGRTDQEVLALRTDPVLSRRMVDALAGENAKAYESSGIKPTDGNLYLAHFLGAGDAVKVLKASADTPLTAIVSPASIEANPAVFGQVKTAGQIAQWADGKMGPGIPSAVKGDASFLNAARKRMKEDLSSTLPAIERRVKAGERVDPGELDDLGAMVFAVGSDDDKRGVVEMALFAEIGDRLAGLSAQEREAAGQEFATRFSQGSTRLESEIGNYVSTFGKKIGEAYKSDPYDAAVRHAKRAPTPAVDFNDPASLDGALKAREAERAFIREHEGIEPVSLLRPREADGLRGALLSTDPKKIMGAASLASNMLARHPDAFMGVTGKDSIEKEALKFRHYVDNLAMSGEEAANRLVMERTPEHQAKVAAKVKSEDVNAIVSKQLSVADIEKAFDPSILPGRPKVGFVLEGPTGLTQEGRAGMYGDYVELFREKYATEGDVETAKSLALAQLKIVWGTSSINGNDTVMRYPPEKAPGMAGIENAPEIVATQAIEAIRELTGDTVERGALRILPLPGLTASAFKSGQQVPYMLGWTDKDGLPHWLPPGKAFAVDTDGAREAQSKEREAGFLEEQRISRLDPAGRLGARLGIPRVFDATR